MLSGEDMSLWINEVDQYSNPNAKRYVFLNKRDVVIDEESKVAQARNIMKSRGTFSPFWKAPFEFNRINIRWQNFQNGPNCFAQ